jgi:diguanylate cyclase (GGDEF)-like protein
MLLGVLLSCIIPYIIGGLYIKNATEDWLYQNYIQHASTMLESTARTVDESILNPMANLTQMMSKDLRILQARDSLRNYTDYDGGFAVDVKSNSEREVEDYLKTIKNAQKIVTMASYGTETGGYVEVPEFNPAAAYDPRTRPWYQSALTTDGVYFSEPYITKVTQELVFAVSHVVHLEEQVIGVVSLTIKLDTLMEEINRQKTFKDGYIVILSPDNRFINSPKHSDWLLTSAAEQPGSLFSNLSQYHGKFFEGVIDGEESILSVYISPYSGWQYVSVVRKANVLKESTVLTGIFVLIYAITLFIIVILIFLIATYITKPILRIAQVINEMAAFQFDQYRSRDFEIYGHFNDEIGEIARALRRMQDNYLELNHTLLAMDEEIKRIDIQQRSNYQLHLSEGNPFVFIMGSVNALLEKVYLYIDQIKNFNREMKEKNQLLVASEEELTAQLEEIESQKEMIRLLAEQDPLTDLPNRRTFYNRLALALERDSVGAVIMLDLDNFKGINDTLGHVFGDKVLQHVAQKLKETASGQAFVSRFGGDEFLILVEHPHPSGDIFSYVKTLQETFGQRLLIDSHEVMIEFSIGITRFPLDSTDMDQLVMNADLALYHVKNSGKNNYALFNAFMSEHLNAKRVIKETLREALDYDGLKLVYQPLVEISTGRTVGYEALLRLKNNLFEPGEFIPVAEEDNLILTLGRRVTEMVVRQMQDWRMRGFAPRSVSINFSAMQIHDHSYKKFLVDCLKTYNVAPELIAIEITENIFLENKESTLVLLREMRDLGIKIAVDDFGTGYSSLSYLTELPINVVKLDRALCHKFLELENIAVMDSLIALAHSLNLKVVAEGIESYEHARRLQVGNCDVIQGFYFSRPLEAAEVEKNYDHIYRIQGQ